MSTIPSIVKCDNCPHRGPDVRLYQHVLAGRPLQRYWQCPTCARIAQEFVDLRPLPMWQERAALGDASGARVTGGMAL
ncbi:MAG TPA: hypothetical protein VFW92_10225 [Candidatus Limnocylindrales bacterium]|nr:hypothetical protein [Candidatus Limnocylindrales bacterium]